MSAVLLFALICLLITAGLWFGAPADVRRGMRREVRRQVAFYRYERKQVGR